MPLQSNHVWDVIHLNDQQALAFIHSRHAVGKRWNCATSPTCWNGWAIPTNSWNLSTWPGTNGRGSTSTYTAAALTKAGYHTGLSSPLCHRVPGEGSSWTAR